MRVLLCFFGIAAGVIAGASAVHAQAGDNTSFRAFTASRFYSSLIDHALAGMPPDVFQKCPALVSAGSRVTVVRPVTFASDGFPNGGVWKQQFQVSGCGNDTTLNFYFQAPRDEKINTLIAAPGSTHADVVLQGDARKYATVAVVAREKDCKALNIKTTTFEAYGYSTRPPEILAQARNPGPGGKRGSWLGAVTPMKFRLISFP
jgi:hypothetical protein